MNTVANTRVYIYKLRKMIMNTNMQTEQIKRICEHIDQLDNDLMIIIMELLRYNYRRIEQLDEED